jgi:hypothetical protein
MNKEFEILERYQNSDEVKTLLAIIEDGTPAEHSVAIDKIINISNQMIVEAGGKLNEHGQQDFVDAIFFDFLMPDKLKLEWLSEYVGDQSERIAYLKEKMKFSKTESANEALENMKAPDTTTTDDAGALKLSKGTD